MSRSASEGAKGLFHEKVKGGAEESTLTELVKASGKIGGGGWLQRLDGTDRKKAVASAGQGQARLED